MPINQKIIHFKYCRLIADVDEFFFRFLNTPYKIIFKSKHFDIEKGVIVENISGNFVDTNLLLWLSVYIGEDFLEPYQEQDTRFSWDRGSFPFDSSMFNRFLKATEKMPPKSYPKWKKELFDKAITYYSVAVRSGVEMMPLTIGFFGMSLECIGNVRYGKRDKHFTLGDKKFIELMNTRFKRYKKSENYKQSTRSYQQLIVKDIELVHIIRNAYYGHSMLHLQKDRSILTNVLRSWFLRSGHNRKFTNISFQVSRIDNDIAREAHALYKVGLRTSRLFIFMLLGFTKSIPFASYDYSVIGDMQDEEVSKYKGIKYTFK